MGVSARLEDTKIEKPVRDSKRTRNEKIGNKRKKGLLMKGRGQEKYQLDIVGVCLRGMLNAFEGDFRVVREREADGLHHLVLRRNRDLRAHLHSAKFMHPSNGRALPPLIPFYLQ